MIYIEIESTGKILPLPKKERLRVTFQAADFGQAGSTNGSFSTSINLPMSAEVLAALGFSNVLNVTSQLSPYKNIKARLLQDNNEIDKGFIRIDEDDIKNKEITITFLGRNVDWFTSLGDKTLRELDLSEYDHFKTNLTINEQRTDGYVYLPVDYGTLESKSTLTIAYDEIYPAIFVNMLVKKIFKEAGYKVTGTLFQKQDFNRLIIPFSQENILNTLEYQKNLTTRVLADFNTAFPASQTRVLLNLPIKTGKTPPPFYLQLTDELENWNTNIYTSPAKMYVKVSLYNYISGINQITGDDVYATGFILAKNGVDIQTLSNSTVIYNHIFSQVLLDVGDTLEVFATFTDSTYANYNFTYLEVLPQLTAVNESKYSLNSFLPEMKQSQLIEYIFFIYGVIPSFDKSTNSVVLDSLSDLTILNAEDWGNKIDYSQSIEKSYFDFVENYAKQNVCKYENEDEDTLQENYINIYKENYGTGVFTIDNDYIDAEQDYFTASVYPTIMRKVFTNVSGLNLYLPYIFRKDADKCKILYFAGFLSLSELTNNQISSITINLSSRNNIPYSYFVNPLQNIVNDPIINKQLSFGIPKDQNTATKSILDSTYGNLQRILNKPISVTVSLRLSAFDIANVKYNRLKYFEQLGGYYYLNKIGQYDGSGESTECELIKWY